MIRTFDLKTQVNYNSLINEVTVLKFTNLLLFSALSSAPPAAYNTNTAPSKMACIGSIKSELGLFVLISLLAYSAGLRTNSNDDLHNQVSQTRKRETKIAIFYLNPTRILLSGTYLDPQLDQISNGSASSVGVPNIEEFG